MEEEKKIKELQAKLERALEELSRQNGWDKSEIKRALGFVEATRQSKYDDYKMVNIQLGSLMSYEKKMGEIIGRDMSEINAYKLELDRLLKEALKKYPLLSEVDVLGCKMEEIERRIENGASTLNLSEEASKTLAEIIDVKKVVLEQKEKIKKEMGDKYKEELLASGSGEVVFVKAEESGVSEGIGKSFSCIVPQRVIELSKKYDGKAFFPVSRRFDYGSHGDFSFCYSVEEIPYDQASLEQKQMYKEREEKIAGMKKLIATDEKEKYDKPGKMSIPIYSEFVTEIDEVLIDVTERELVGAGLLPEEVRWKSLEQIEKENSKKTKVNSRDIAKASVSKGVKIDEVKKVWGKIVDKVKNMFVERG